MTRTVAPATLAQTGQSAVPICARQDGAGPAVRPVYVVEVGVADETVVIQGLARSPLASVFALWHGIGRGAVVLWVPAAGVLS